MKVFKTIYDISVALGAESIDYPGDTPFSRTVVSTPAEGGAYDVSTLVMSAHTGSHIDAPAHFIPGGASVDAYSIENFVLPAHVITVSDNHSIRAEDVLPCDIGPGEAVLFKTDNSLSGRSKSGVFSDRYVYLSPEAASFCAERKVALVGLDYATIERHGDNAFASHRILLKKGILVLEGIDLEAVSAGRYTLFCFPLKIRGAEAAPVRAVLCR